MCRCRADRRQIGQRLARHDARELGDRLADRLGDERHRAAGAGSPRSGKLAALTANWMFITAHAQRLASTAWRSISA
jgi:hypothetical protein